MAIRLLTNTFSLLTLGVLVLAGCSPSHAGTVPPDFLFIMDVKSAGDYEGCAVHVNLEIDSKGRGRFELYDTECAIEFDSNHMVTYKRGQVIESGKLKLNESEIEQLWKAINKNNFFELEDDYRMSMGFSYAFIVVVADGRRHMVDNIGMEVPEVRAIVEATDAILPEGIHLDYGEGYSPS